MQINTDWELLAKYLSGECTAEEVKKFENWLSSDPGNINALEEMKKVWETPEEEFEPSDVKALWQGLTEKAGISSEFENQKIFKLEPQRDKKSLTYIFTSTPKLLKYAAGIIFAILIPTLIYIISVSPVDNIVSDWISITVEEGKQSQLTLSDGTKVTLDAGSYFEYPNDFSENKREVKLNGEAYFEVAHNPTKPFIVNANNAIVKVLGTKFNIRAWEFNKNVKVVVTEGKVSLGKVDELSDTVLISKGYIAELFSDGTLSQPKAVSVEKSLSWIDGEKYFEDSDLSEVISQIERWYDVSITLSDSTILSEKVSIFIQKKSLTDALEIISELTDSEYEQSENKIHITSRTSKPSNN